MTRNIFQQLYYKDLSRIYKRFNGVILDNTIQDIRDIQDYLEKIARKIKNNERILISYHNHLWEPVLSLASFTGLRKKVDSQNWLDQKDVENLLNLSGFDVITSKKRFLGIITITIARLKEKFISTKKSYSTSIIIPVRNEEGNIPKIIPSIPKFGKWQEIIFVEGHSKDKSWEKVNNQIKKYPNKKILAFKQKGKGKADAVWLGFSKARGDILIIYDADRTVAASDLPKFYNALSAGYGEFANGSRLVYPMEHQAMLTLNKIGNTFFSFTFTKILGQRFKDTLCGTKALFRKDYLIIRQHNKKYFKMDPFGDFALIFGAIKNNLKVVEIPVRYKERSYGSTNISRFKHGLLLFRMTLTALKEFMI